MKYILGVLSLLLAGAVVVMAWNNPSAHIALTVPFIKLTIFTNSFVYIVAIMVVGFCAGLLMGSVFALNQKEKLSPYKRQVEKLSVMKDSNQSRVEVLEAKIKTLETALQQSLENK